MVKLLIKDFKNTKAQKNHICSYCRLGIQKGVFYKKYQMGYSIIKIHTLCFSSLSLDLIPLLIENYKELSNTNKD